jgi:hypothetical protein
MKFHRLQQSIANKYSQLLSVLILLFLGAPLLDGVIGKVIRTSVFLAMIISVIRTFDLGKIKFFLLAGLAGAAFFFDLFSTVRLGMELDQHFFLIPGLIYSVFIIAAILLINRRIFLEQQVTIDTIKGGISVFLLIGFLWTLFYRILYIFDSSAFSQSVKSIDLFKSMFYFSFTTITTVGYGDITPVSDFARTLANLEAIIGIMYPSIFIARLVGLYTAQELNKRD